MTPLNTRRAGMSGMPAVFSRTVKVTVPRAVSGATTTGVSVDAVTVTGATVALPRSVEKRRTS